ncbi:MAG: glycosyltransferase [Chloroflexi bacterium]|nr:glycosyltransferase [Chloroflexota bacterium]
MKPRIAMLSVHTSPLAALGGKETGGMNVYIREVCRALAKQGWLIDIFTRSQDNSPQVMVDQPAPGCRTINIEAGPRGSMDRREVFSVLPEFTQGVRAFCQEQQLNYALIHSHYWLSGWVAMELARDWHIPIIQMFHTLGRMKDAAAQDPAQREASNRARAEQTIMDIADRIVAATPLDRLQMVNNYQVNEAKIAVIPCGVNLELFHPMPKQLAYAEVGVPPNKKLLVFIGRLDPVKGLKYLLQALCELSKMNPKLVQELCLAIIGGDRESHLQALREDIDCITQIKDIGLDDMVFFYGPQAQERLPAYYSAAEICVMPSLYESFGMVALEAMACGTPVIASRVGGLTFTIRDGETGFLVPERNPKALAEKISLVMEDACLRHRLSHRAQQVAQSYSWETVADQLVNLYGELGVSLASNA